MYSSKTTDSKGIKFLNSTVSRPSCCAFKIKPKMNIGKSGVKILAKNIFTRIAPRLAKFFKVACSFELANIPSNIPKISAVELSHILGRFSVKYGVSSIDAALMVLVVMIKSCVKKPTG
jgi:hypothetical protein